MQLERVTAPGRGVRAASRRRVLLAEDERALRVSVAAALARDDCEIVEVDDGRALRALLEAVRDGHARAFDVIVADVQLSGGTAFDVLASPMRDWLTTPVLLVTGFCDQHVHLTAELLGVACVLQKPFDTDVLRAAVRRFSGRTRPSGVYRRPSFA